MKLTTLFLVLPFLLFITSSFQQTLPECLLEQGCVANLTIIEGYLPVSPGIYKKTSWILLFADKLVFAFENLQIKSFSYAELNLDCGPESNKICPIQSYLSKYPEHLIPKPEFSHKFCYVLHSIFSEKISYLCLSQGDDQLEAIDKINTLSRLVDNFQIKMMREEDYLLNHFPRKQHNIFVLSNNRLVFSNVKVFFHNIQGFLGEKMLFEWELKTINTVREISSVPDAIRYKTLTAKQLQPLQKALNTSKSSINSSDCIVLFLKSEPQYFCSKAKNLLFSIKDIINAFINRYNYIKDYELLSSISKAHNNTITFNPYMRELATMRGRILRLDDYDSSFCVNNKAKINMKACLDAKTRDIQDEMYFLSQNSENILTSLKKVRRIKPMLKIPYKSQQKTLSFIQIDQVTNGGNEPSEENLKKSDVFKKKIMDKLQANRKWVVSEDERSKGDFRKRTDSDPFVTYLGYIRDSMLSSFKAQEEKLLKK